MTLRDEYGPAVTDFRAEWERDRLNPVCRDALVPSNKRHLVLNANRLTLYYYLLENGPEVLKFARETIDGVMEFYFGEWREKIGTDLGTIDREWWRANISWIPYFQAGLCWGSALNDWSAVKRIAEYPTDQSKDGGCTKEDRAAYLALACFLKDESGANLDPYFQQIDKGKKLKPKLLAAVIRALQIKESTTYQKALAEYLEYFRKSEFKKGYISNVFSLDGTILVNLGKREGFEFSIESKVEDYVIRLK